jgi:capsular polysaccharide biosynthesis protein
LDKVKEDRQFATIDLEAVAHALLHAWPVYIICFVAGAVILFVVASFLVPKQYEATVQFYVNSSTATAASAGANSGTGSTSTDESVQTGQIDTSRKLATTYIVILQNTGVEQRVAAQLGGNATAADIAGAVSMEPVNDTEVVQISARTTSPEMSKEICDAYAKVAPSVLERVVQGGSVQIIDNTAYSTDPVFPSVPQFTLLGGLAALVIALIVVYLRFTLDKTVKTRAGIAEALDCVGLGEIPSFKRKR